MNVEIALQEGIYDNISELLSRATSIEKASGYIAAYLHMKLCEGVIDTFDYSIKDMGIDGIQAIVEFSFAWNVGNMCNMLVFPKRSPAKAFDHAMGVI